MNASVRRFTRAAFASALVFAALPRGVARGEGHDKAAQLEAAVATITPDELREHEGVLADDTLEGREAGKRGGRAAARYIETQLKSREMQPGGDNGGFLQRFSPNYQNLLAVVPGTDPELKGEYILVGAHYDHVGYGTWRNSNGPTGYIHNGADDNASGVSCMLELVDALHRTHWQPRRSIIIAFWDGEEINLLGSRYWVKSPTVPLDKVKLAVNVDMIGRLREGRLEVGGTRTAPGLRHMLSSQQLPKDLWLDFSWEFKENSDHWPFFVAGVPSLLIHTGLHADYHTPRDDIEKLNVPGMRLASAYVLETVCRAADADELPKFRAASRSENPTVQQTREAPLPPAEPRLGLTWTWTTEGQGHALRVESVAPRSAAEAAGLRTGDRITSVDGAPIVNEILLAAAVLRAETQLTLDVVRQGAPTTDVAEVTVALEGAPVQLGLSWREDESEPGAVFITRVVPYSPAARAGIKLNDRLYACQGEPFASGDALLSRVRELLAASPDAVQFEVETAGHIRTVDVDLRLPTAAAGDASL
jgi:hypothetical protein